MPVGTEVEVDDVGVVDDRTCRHAGLFLTLHQASLPVFAAAITRAAGHH